MTLATLKAVCAAYHRKIASDLTINSIDLFLVAANNARKNAEKLHSFENSKLTATLDIDGVMGGALSAAVFTGSAETFLVTGTLSPDLTGTYTRNGTYGGYPLYTLAGSPTSFLYFNLAAATYLLGRTLTNAALTDSFTPASDITAPAGSYVATGANTGTATVAAGLWTFSGIKEILDIQRTNGDSSLEPLDFTSSSRAIGRVRDEQAVLDDYDLDARYPSDARILATGSASSLVLRNGTLFIYPLAAASGDPLETTIEAVGWLRDYVAADLNSASATDFIVEHGFEYLQWSVIVELNFYFKTFVPRTEGNLNSPEARAEEARRRLVVWDSFAVDPNSVPTR